MKRLLLSPVWAAACSFLLFTNCLVAQTAGTDTAVRLQALEERIRQLEAEVGALKAAGPAAPGAATAPAGVAEAVLAAPAPPATVQAQAALPVYGGASALSKALNPDISVTGNFLGAFGPNAIRPVPAFELREAEAAFQAIVDPYARADFFLSFGKEGVELEEGFLTFTSLPGGLVARVGKMRASFGKVNTLHTHALPWTDRPLLTENLLGGEEGISDAGVSVSRIIPAPKNLFLEATGQVFHGDTENVFQATRRSDVSFIGHLRAFHDITEATNLDLGFSYGRGHNDIGSDFLTHLYGADLTLRWKPLRRAIYRSLLARSEFVWSRRRQETGAQRAFGFYTSADYRLTRRWTAGGRYDWSERMREGALHDSGFSAVLTYWPSEFSQVRGQYRFARYGERRDANELRFQFLFNLGVHGAHPF